MRKMLGAVLILLASVYGAYLLLLRQRERRKDILALQSSLLILKRELEERLTPLKECFELLQQREKRESVKAFYQQLVAGMTSLGVKRFSALWHQTVTDTLTFLGSQETERVCSLGAVLEGADAEPLCEPLCKNSLADSQVSDQRVHLSCQRGPSQFSSDFQSLLRTQSLIDFYDRIHFSTISFPSRFTGPAPPLPTGSSAPGAL